jgi:hypothetical protein
MSRRNFEGLVKHCRRKQFILARVGIDRSRSRRSPSALLVSARVSQSRRGFTLVARSSSGVRRPCPELLLLLLLPQRFRISRGCGTTSRRFHRFVRRATLHASLRRQTARVRACVRVACSLRSVAEGRFNRNRRFGAIMRLTTEITDRKLLLPSLAEIDVTHN